MVERVEEEATGPPYLHDESQEVARAWGAEKTPHVFVLDGEGMLRTTAPQTPTTRTPPMAPPGSARRSMPCSRDGSLSNP